MAKKLFWFLFAFLSVAIGLYPIIYFIIDIKFGLLSTKNNELLANSIWKINFFTHIIFGGLALLFGWVQFSKKIRAKHLKLHKNIGKFYILCVLLSSTSGIYIAHFATGGMIASLGFICLGIIWLFTTLQAFKYVKDGKIIPHQKMMIYSYAACFAAVTLRIWLPLLVLIFKDFNTAYVSVAWFCWVPNLIAAFFINKKVFAKKTP